MKFTLTSIIFGGLLASFASAQTSPPHYTVTDLGTLAGGAFSQAFGITNNGLITGLSTAADGTQHAVAWLNGKIVDVSSPGLGGPNSSAGGANNGNFGGINNLGQVAGYAENTVHDAGCSGVPAVNGTGPQVLDFLPVIWGAKPGTVRKLLLLAGDSVGLALSINDFGQSVGITGSCPNTGLPGFTTGSHAVLWESDGSVHDLGNLGGTANPSLLAVGNAANAINNRGQIAGGSALPGSTTFHPYLWTRGKGMQDLGVLDGDLAGSGLAINNENEIVGASISAPGPLAGNPRAFLWKNGTFVGSGRRATLSTHGVRDQ